MVFNKFLKSVEQFPDKIAIVAGGHELTYKELASIVCLQRNRILEKGFGKEKLIGVVTGDDLYTYGSILAILSLGAGYVPLNIKNPRYRNEEIILQAGLSCVLSSTELLLNNALVLDSRVSVNQDNEKLEPVSIGDASIAYLFFTSGSTGKPKGVPIYHKNLTSFLATLTDVNEYDFSSEDRFIQTFELTFDLSVMSFFVPLCIGASVYVIPQKKQSYLSIYSMLLKDNITVALMVPSVLTYLRPYFSEIYLPHLRYSLFCGEALYSNLTSEWAKCVPNAEIQNVYGPTEATIFCLRYAFNRNSDNLSENGVLSIGFPMPNMRAFIMKNSTFAKEFEKGELLLQGAQVTDSYWRNSDKTKESFLHMDNKVFYRTGDLCYFDKEGVFYYCGRLDNQVKLNGYRIELGEIEFNLKEITNIDNFVVTIVGNKGAEFLYGVYEGEVIDSDSVLSALSKKLPSYMHPRELYNIAKMPHNLNGKIDRNKVKEIVVKILKET